MIGVYDIDLYHHAKYTFPNFNLMKLFNYFYTEKNISISFLRPCDTTTHLEHIYYFWETPNGVAPKTINLNEDNVTLLGYGPRKERTLLIPEIQATPPIFLPYELNRDKLKDKKKFDAIKKNSFINIFANDFSLYKSDKTDIYIFDRDFIELENGFDFLQEQKNKHLHFNGPLKFYDEETFSKYAYYRTRFMDTRLCVYFKPSNDFIKKYSQDAYYLLDKTQYKDDMELYLTIVKIISCGKAKDFTPNLVINFDLPLKEELTQWNYSCTQDSFYNFTRNLSNQNKVDDVLLKNTELRLLSKTKPKNFIT